MYKDGLRHGSGVVQSQESDIMALSGLLLGLLTSSKLLYQLPAITDYWIENWSIGMAT